MRSPRAAARSVAAAFPRRHGHPSLRLGRPAAPALAQSACPPLRLPPRRRPAAGAVLLSRKGVASRFAALALACAPRCAPPRPLPSSRGLRLRCGASSLASAWARARRAGGLRAPPLPPLRASLRFRSLGGALPRGLRPRLFLPPAPAEKRFLSPLRRRRGKAAAAAYLRRLRVCAASCRSSVYSGKLSERETTAQLLILTG